MPSIQSAMSRIGQVSQTRSVLQGLFGFLERVDVVLDSGVFLAQNVVPRRVASVIADHQTVVLVSDSIQQLAALSETDKV